MTVRTIAFFGKLIDSGTPRGALRLFRALAAELASRDDLDLICLGEPAFDPSDPVGCVYHCWDGRGFLTVLLGGELPKATEANLGPVGTESASEQPMLEWVHRAEDLMAAYRRKVPLSVRYRLRGITRLVRILLWKYTPKTRADTAIGDGEKSAGGARQHRVTPAQVIHQCGHSRTGDFT